MVSYAVGTEGTVLFIGIVNVRECRVAMLESWSEGNGILSSRSQLMDK